MHSDDVGVVEGGHDLNLPPDVHEVLLILDFVLPDGFDGHLRGEHRGEREFPEEEIPPSLPSFGKGLPTTITTS